MWCSNCKREVDFLPFQLHTRPAILLCSLACVGEARRKWPVLAEAELIDLRLELACEEEENGSA